MHSPMGLSNLLADLQHARQQGDLGRLAFVSYCDARRWARDAGQPALADQAARLVTESPHPSRDDFLSQVDQLIAALQALCPTEPSAVNGVQAKPERRADPSAPCHNSPRPGWSASSTAA